MKSYLKLKDKKKCYGCYACAEICPKKCITMCKDKKGFYYPKVDKSKCINCGMCEKVCPKINKSKVNNSKEMVPYCAYSEHRNTSTSGGIFPVLAEYIIENKGVVFGVRYDKDMHVIYDMIDDVKDIKYMVGSKYVRADVTGILDKVKKELKTGKLVLFVGTPCQVNGLKNYLIKDYDNLYLCDIFCHATPSPYVFEKYVEYLEKKYDDKVTNINFRNKEKGWLNSNTKITFKNKTIEACKNDIDDAFLELFYNAISTRECCTECDYPNLNRAGDITIADFWGVDKFYPDFDYEDGASLLLLNNEKGKQFYKKIKKKIVSKEIKKDEVLKYNHNKSVPENILRDYFFRELDKHDIVIAYNKLKKKMNNYKNPLYRIYYKITGRIKRLLKKSLVYFGK